MIKKGYIALLLTIGLLYSGANAAGADEIVIENIEEEAAAEVNQFQENGEEDGGDIGQAEGNLIDDGGSVSVVSEGLTLEQALESEAQAAREEREQYYLPIADLTIDAAGRQSLTEYLINLRIAPSPTGSDGELEMASYIRRVCEELGYTVEEQSFHEGFLNENYIDVPGVNIIAERGADGAERTKDILILTAHYDSKTDPREDDLTANDKSGAAVLLETARILADVESNVDICFVFLSGEEDGWYGSQNFAKHLSEEQRSRICGVISLDRIGYIAQGEIVSDQIYMGLSQGQEENELTERISRSVEEWQLEENAGLSGVELSQETEQSPSEQSADGKVLREEWSILPNVESSGDAFAQAGIPVVTIFQDLTGVYRYTEPGENDGEDAPIETMSENDSETENHNRQQTVSDVPEDVSSGSELNYEELEEETEMEESARLYLADAEISQIWDIEKLQMVTDILARTVAEYMF